MNAPFSKDRPMLSNLCNTSYKYISNHEVEKNRAVNSIISEREWSERMVVVNMLSAQCVKQRLGMLGNSSLLFMKLSKGKALHSLTDSGTV